MIPGAALYGLAMMSGLALGSYAVTAGIRLGRAESSLSGRSHCDACGQTLGVLETLPMLSYALARGVCRHCKAPIDRTHLAGEVAGLAVLAAAVASRDVARGPLLAALGLLLICSAAVDWKVGRLPDVLTALIALAAAALAGLQSMSALRTGALAAVAAFLILQALRWAFSRLRDDPGLGFGDVKLISALALWTGLATPWMAMGGAVIGLLAMAMLQPEGGRLPFGPALAAAGWIAGMGGELGFWPTTA